MTNMTISFLVGTQRALLLFIYKECKKRHSNATSGLTKKRISSLTGICAGTIKNSITRLKQKGFIDIIESKNGRGGWSRYTILEKHLQELPLFGGKKYLHWQKEQATSPENEPFPGDAKSYNYIRRVISMKQIYINVSLRKYQLKMELLQN